MNQKEISELKRRFRLGKNAIGRIYGCYVNSQKEIVSYLDESLDRMPEEEAEKYLALLKKTLSGALGRNLIDIVFSTQQVADSDEHRRLMALRDSRLKDGEVRQEFYQTVIDSLDMGESNYLILLAHDAYDVPHRGKDGEDRADEGDTVFSYIVCCVCPVKDGKLELSYCAGENEFHNCAPSQIVSPPELGFLFPAFDDRAANIYNALTYARKPDELHQEFLDAIFHTEPPMSAGEQREAFQTALREGLEGACGLEVVQAVHGRLTELVEEHKASKNPEPLTVSKHTMRGILEASGVPEEKAQAFEEKYDEAFEGGAVSPKNLINVKECVVRTANATIKVDPDCGDLVETRLINGRKYILVRVEGDVEFNGIQVQFDREPPEEEQGETPSPEE